MNTKIHIAFISLIVLVIFLLWKMLNVVPEEKEPLIISGYAIEITRATYGKECEAYAEYMNPIPEDPYSGSKNKRNNSIENNVLTEVSNRCNGQVRCSIPADPKSLKEGLVSCGGATLQVEYRCFMLDRLRRGIVKNSDTMSLDCSTQQ